MTSYSNIETKSLCPTRMRRTLAMMMLEGVKLLVMEQRFPWAGHIRKLRYLFTIAYHG